MTLQVIGAGLGRTGTHSLALALEMLGIAPCYHIQAVSKHPHHIDLWNDAMDGKDVDWHTLFSGYKAAVEWPAVAFLKLLIEAYPQAKVTLTLRDAESWYASAVETIFEGLELSQYNPNPERRKGGAMKRRLILDTVFGGKYRDKAYAIGVYERHVAFVHDLVPEHRLLAFNVKEGWQPLCTFLGTSIPDSPFPRVNDRSNHLSTMPDWAKQAKAERENRDSQ